MIWGLRKPVEARGNGTKAPAAWAQIIDDYMLTLAAAGQPPTTTELRRIQLVRMARDIGGRPADVAGEKFVEWFGRQTGWAIETRRSYRAWRSPLGAVCSTGRPASARSLAGAVGPPHKGGNGGGPTLRGTLSARTQQGPGFTRN